MRAMMVAEDDGYTLVGRRPIPKGTLISELPVRPTGGNQASRRNQFAPLLCSGYSSADCVEACCEPRDDDDGSEQEWPSLGLAADGTFNSQVKAAGSREKENNKRGTTYSKIKQDPKGQTRPVEDIDQVIEEFTRNDAVSAAAAAAKGVQQTMDAAVEHKRTR